MRRHGALRAAPAAQTADDFTAKGYEMPQTGNKIRKAVRQWLADCRDFFDSTAGAGSERNWENLRPMSLLYLVLLCIYLFAVCLVLDIAVQTAAVRAFALAQAAFTLWVFLWGKKTPPVWTVDLTITLFAAQILGLSGFLGVAVFPAEASFLFPLFLVLMTQIYTRRPLYPILEVLIPAAVYLVFCWRYKSGHAFLLDAISVAVAIAISGAALFSATNYKVSAWRAQTALQKLCALDPMTGVSNKSTFEFLTEEYLRSMPAGGYALAVCDLDDFKGINDTYGHRVGDEVLMAFSVQLRRLVEGRPELLVGRFGGDEFVLFFKRYDTQQQVLTLLSRLCAVPGFAFAAACSVGVAFSASGSADFERLFDVADQSLYRAKNGRTGGVCAADADAAAPPKAPGKHLPAGRTDAADERGKP